jgi:hypothetical protein
VVVVVVRLTTLREHPEPQTPVAVVAVEVLPVQATVAQVALAAPAS